MASNETTVSGDVLYQSGDDLSEANLTRSAARSNATDYVERGLSVVVDDAAGTIDINSGHCIVQDGIHAYDAFPNQVTDISLPAPNGVNHVFLVIDETVDDDIAYHVDDDDTPPANPSLKIATADGGAGTATPLNPDPAAAFNQAALADRAAQPSGVSDKRVLYVDESDGNVYKVNPDGTEEQLGGGGIFEDTDGDGVFEQTTGDGIQSPSVSTDDLQGNYSSRVRAITGNGVVGTFDKTGASPIQDAIDAINTDTGNGHIHVPDATETAGNLTDFSQMSIIGQRPKTQILQTDTTVPLINADTNANARDCFWDRLKFVGPGPASGSSPAITFGEQISSFHAGRLWFADWDASAIIDATTGGPFASHWEYARVDNSSGQFIHTSNNGQLWRIGGIETYLNSVSYAVNAGAGQRLQIGYISCGGSVDFALFSQGTADQSVQVGYINYEPTGTNGDSVVLARSEASTLIGQITVNGATVSEGLKLGASNGNVTVLNPIYGPGATFNTGKVVISKAPASESWYFGPSSDIVDSAAAGTNLVRSMATAGTGNG